jgi:SAM-dependent methyltransferase
MDKKQNDIQEVQDFWTKNPMTYGIDKNKNPEQIIENSVSKLRLTGWFLQEPNKSLLSNLIDYSSHKDKNVLEIGHGVGFLAREFIEAEAKYTGIDLSSFHHKHCMEIFGHHDNAKFYLGNAEELPFEDNSFDYVISLGVMHHSPDTQKCIDEAWRVLKEGSTLFVMLYHKSFLKYYYNKFFKYGILRGEYFLYRSIQKVVEKHTDPHGDGSGAPISRHYRVSDIPILFNKFSSYRQQVYGGYSELNGFPSTRFNIGQFMSDNLKQKILKKHGGYLYIWAVK